MTSLGKKPARGGERAARRALRDALRAAERSDMRLPEVQLLGQMLPTSIYTRLRKGAKTALRRQQVILPDDPPRTGGVVMLWAIEAGAECAPRPGSSRVPEILGMPLAAMVEFGRPYESAWWLLIRERLAGAPPARLAVPVLERWGPDGGVQRTVVDFGLRFPLPAFDARGGVLGCRAHD